MLIKQLADEIGPTGGRVVGLMPGRVETERTRSSTRATPTRRPHGRPGRRPIPLRRYGRPDEFGRVAAFVLSPAASYLTGCVVPVEGGALRSL